MSRQPPTDRLRQPIALAYPENANYVDNGCHLHPKCLRCPRARCILDEPPVRGNPAQMPLPVLPPVLDALPLSYSERLIAAELARAEGYVPHDDLSRAILGQPVTQLRTHISNMRAKGVPIRTVKGMGYALEVGA